MGCKFVLESLARLRRLVKADSYSFYMVFSSVGICAKLVETTILINERLYSNLNASDSRDKNNTTILLTKLSA